MPQPTHSRTQASSDIRMLPPSRELWRACSIGHTQVTELSCTPNVVASRGRHDRKAERQGRWLPLRAWSVADLARSTKVLRG